VRKGWLCVPCRPRRTRIDFVPDESSGAIQRGHCGGAAPHERIEHKVAFEGIEVDEPFNQGHREGSGMTHTTSRLRRNLPDARGRSHEFFPGDSGEPFLRPVEPLLGKDEDIFVQVPQGGIARRHPRTPRAGACRAFALHPYDLTAHEKTEVARKARNMRVQRHVRLSAKVGDVEGHPPSGDQYPLGLLENLFEEREVLFQREVEVVLFSHVVRRRRHHEGHGIVRQLAHLLGRVLEHPVEAMLRDVARRMTGNRGRWSGEELSTVKRGRVVPFALAGAK